MCKTWVVPWLDVPKSCHALLARPAQPSGRSAKPIGIALPKLVQILEAGIPAGGQSVTEMSAPAIRSPLQQALAGESEQVAVRGSAIRRRVELRAYLVWTKRSPRALENRLVGSRSAARMRQKVAHSRISSASV